MNIQLYFLFSLFSALLDFRPIFQISNLLENLSWPTLLDSKIFYNNTSFLSLLPFYHKCHLDFNNCRFLATVYRKIHYMICMIQDTDWFFTAIIQWEIWWQQWQIISLKTCHGNIFLKKYWVSTCYERFFGRFLHFVQEQKIINQSGWTFFDD